MAIPRTTHQRKQLGQTIVEVLIAIGLAGIMLPTLAGALVTSRYARPTAQQQLVATGLMREATEAVRSVREHGWGAFAVDGTYHPTISGSAWTLASGSETINGFSRQIVVSDVQRNSSGTIVSSGGTADPSTKQVVVTVSWSAPYNDSISSQTYVSRWNGNTTWTQNTQTAFNGGTLTNTTTTALNTVQLSGSSGISWATPSLAGSYNAAAAATAIYVDTSTNRAYIGVGTSLKIIDISTPTSPTLLGSYTATSTIKGIAVSGNYAYLATASTTTELNVVNVTTPSAPTTAATKAVGNTASTSIAISGNYAYIGDANSSTQNEFYIVNIATPTSPVVTSSVSLSNGVNAVAVSGNYAYLATSISSQQLVVINVTTPASPTIAGSIDPGGTVAGLSVFAQGTTVYLGEAANTGNNEFSIINASNPAAMTVSGGYKVSAAVNGIYVSGSQAFLATALSASQFLVLSISSPSSITKVGSLSLSTENGIAPLGNYICLASTNTAQSLQVVQGTVTSTYLTSGTFISSTFDPGATAGFNYLTFTDSVPSNTTLQFQIANNTDNATWNYVGPDGTASTYYTTGAAIPLANASARYFRYKAYFTSNGSATPTFSSVTLNYSP